MDHAPMPDSINGLPLHPLVVHAVVVLLPLAAIGVLAIAVRPRWRARYGVLVTTAAVLSVLLIPIATSSGESLEQRVGDPGQHARLGDQLIWFALPLAIAAAALTWLDRRSRRGGDRGEGGAGGALSTRIDRPAVRHGVAGLAVVLAIGAAAQVYRVGDSGARAAWGDTAASTSSGGDHDDD